MELTRPAPRPVPRWRIALPVWLGIVLLLASVGIAAVELRSHASDSSSTSNVPASNTGDGRWMAIGYADVEGGVTPLYPVTPGRVKSIQAHENEPVQANAELFRLDDSAAVLLLRKAEKGVEIARQQVIVAEQKANQYRQQISAQEDAVKVAASDVERARINRDKQKKDFKNNLVDEQAFQDAQELLRKAEAGLEGKKKELAALKAIDPEEGIKVARLNVDLRENEVDQARKAVEEHVIRAPYAGTPLRILISVGETLGSNPRQPAIQFCPDRPLLVRVEVEQEFAGRIHKGQTVRIQDHITGEDLGRGTISSISRWFTHRRSILLDPLIYNDVRTLECVIKLDSSAQALRIGQRVRTQFSD
jgi:multidrug resistance efflux pump